MLPHSISIGDFNHVDETKEYQRFLMHGLALKKGTHSAEPPPSPFPVFYSVCKLVFIHNDNNHHIHNNDNKTLGKHVSNFTT